MPDMIRVGEFRVDGPIRDAVERVLASGRISEGKETRAFEEAFSRFVGTKHAVAVNSGTSALIAGLSALKLRALEESGGYRPYVVTSPLTYVATANAVVLAGMEPLFVDVDPDTFGIRPELVHMALEQDRAGGIGGLLPVHLMGYVCDMDPLRTMARNHDCFLFEDSSQAHGSMYKNRRAGSMSDMSSFSFYIAHNIQAGELGAVLTNDPKLAKLVRKIKANGRVCDCIVCTRDKGKCPRFRHGTAGWDPRFYHDLIGYNFKTMEFPAAIANAQVARADQIAAKRRRNVRVLNDILAKHEGDLKLPVYSDKVSYLGYPVVIEDPKVLNRERLQVALERNGVETRPLFGCIPIHQPSFGDLKKKYRGKLPNAEYIGANGFYIGCHQYLTDRDLQKVASAFDKSLKETARR